jgi:hypothetical protein
MSEAAVSHDQTATSVPSKETRERSTIDFPYSSLDDAIEVAKAVHKLGGNQCRLGALAAELGHDTINSGGFRQKLSTAHTFGFTSLSQGIVSLSELGSKVINPDHEKAARAQAFLSVPLYRAIYEDFEGKLLPPAQGLESAMVNLGVVEKQAARARQAFQKSAKEAGFFTYGATKLVYPAIGANEVPPKVKEDENRLPDPKQKNGGTGNGGGGGNEKKRHPFIEGLLETLPPAELGMPKTEWSLQDRQEWLQTAAGIFNLIYKAGTEDTGRNVVTVVPLPPKSAS